MFIKVAEKTYIDLWWLVTCFFVMHFCSASFKSTTISSLTTLLLIIFLNNLRSIHSVYFPMVSLAATEYCLAVKKIFNNTHGTFSGVFYCSSHFSKTQETYKSKDLATAMTRCRLTLSICLHKSTDDATPIPSHMANHHRLLSSKFWQI